MIGGAATIPHPQAARGRPIVTNLLTFSPKSYRLPLHFIGGLMDVSAFNHLFDEHPEQLEIFDFDYAEQRWVSYLENWKEFK